MAPVVKVAKSHEEWELLQSLLVKVGRKWLMITIGSALMPTMPDVGMAN
jgi:hypothetical protein